MTTSTNNNEESIKELVFEFIESETLDQVRLSEGINKEIEAFSPAENSSKDATDGIFDILATISDSVQEKFDEILSSHSEKNRCVRALSKLFALLLNTKVVTAEKIKCIIKIAIETTLKLWQEPKQQ